MYIKDVLVLFQYLYPLFFVIYFKQHVEFFSNCSIAATQFSIPDMNCEKEIFKDCSCGGIEMAIPLQPKDVVMGVKPDS